MLVLPFMNASSRSTESHSGVPRTSAGSLLNYSLEGLYVQANCRCEFLSPAPAAVVAYRCNKCDQPATGPRSPPGAERPRVQSRPSCNAPRTPIGLGETLSAPEYSVGLPHTDIVPYTPLRSRNGHGHNREVTPTRGHRHVLRALQ